ncbi:MAG: tetratricopeptide repeat protein, partial [Actinomycetes bacterium]
MLTLTARTDAHGNPVSGSPAAVDRYDAAVDHLLAYRNDVVDAMTSLAADEPGFAMGQVLAAYLSLTSTDLPDVAGAQEIADHLATLELNEREAAHRGAIDAWLSGDWHGAARRLDALLVRWPADLLGLLVGHQLDFFVGDAANLRDRVGRSLRSVDPRHPHHGYVRGMYAFGLEECGSYELAEAHGLAAVDRNPGDVWATHAVTHVYEMRGQVDRGIRFLREHQADWAEGNLFSVHNWWHLALY